jgi:predicted deacylase
MIERRTIVFQHELLAGVEHPAFEAHGASNGPRLTLLGGIHGCEYSSIAAVIRFMNELDTDELAGSITAVPVVSMQSFRRRSPFVVPEDGKNLNRCFPGSYDGTYTEVLARSIYDELIAPADVVLDLHGGDMVEALVPFTGYEASPVEEQARALALAFGFPYIVRETPQDGRPSGMTTSASADGIPVVLAEAGGRGQLEESMVRLLVDGLIDALRRLEMLPGDVTPPRQAMSTIGRLAWLRCASAGWWETTVAPGDEVAERQLLGRVRNLFGDVLEEVRAPADGVVLFLTTSAAVDNDGLLLGLGTELAPV